MRLKGTTPEGYATQPARWPPRGPVRVLVVLGQLLVVHLARVTLRHGEYDTRTTTIGAEALTALGNWHPHLVLVDMDLEGGQDLQRYLRERSDGRAPACDRLDAPRQSGDQAGRL